MDRTPEIERDVDPMTKDKPPPWFEVMVQEEVYRQMNSARFYFMATVAIGTGICVTIWLIALTLLK